jgi:hypothetical protein
VEQYTNTIIVLTTSGAVTLQLWHLCAIITAVRWYHLSHPMGNSRAEFAMAVRTSSGPSMEILGIDIGGSGIKGAGEY